MSHNGSLNTELATQTQTDCQTDRKPGIGDGWCQTPAGRVWIKTTANGICVFERYVMLMCVMGAGSRVRMCR